MLLAGCDTAPASGSPGASVPGSAAASPAAAAEVDARIPADGIGAFAVGDGSVWVANFMGMTVSRIDPLTNEVDTTIRIADAVAGGFGLAEVDFANDAAWVTNGVDSTLVRIDPTTNEVVARIPLGTPPPDAGTTRPLGMAFTPGAVWVANNIGTDTAPHGAVVRVDVASQAVVAEIELGDTVGDNGPATMVVSGGLLWVGVRSLNAVVVIDPATNAVVAQVPDAGGCGYLAEAAGSVWIACEGVVLRIDPDSHEVVARIEVGGTGPMPLTAGFDSLWTRTRETGVLARIDPATNAVVSTLELAPGGPVFEIALDVGFDALWARELNTVVRLNPLPQ